MSILSSIIDRLNQRIEVGNIFDQIYGLSELIDHESGKRWVHYIGDGQAEAVTGYDAKQGTLFWGKRGKVSVTKTDAYRHIGCQQAYETRWPLTAYAVVKKSHLPCDSSDAVDWIAARVYKLASGTDPQFKAAIKVLNYESIPAGYADGIKSLPFNFEYACVAIDIDAVIITTSADSCYDACETGDIPLPDFEPCQPCLTQVYTDGETIVGNGTQEDPLVAIGGGGGGSIRVQDDGVTVTNAATNLDFRGTGVAATLNAPGDVHIQIDRVNLSAGTGVSVTGTYPNLTVTNTAPATGSEVTAVTASAPLSSSGGTTPDVSISQASSSTDGYLSAADWSAFDGKQDALTAGTGISLAGDVVTNTAPDQTVVLNAGTGIGVSGTYPNFTISNTQDVSGFVPYTGATQDVDLDANSLNAESLSVTGTNGAGHVHLRHQASNATATGQTTSLFADSNGDLKTKNDNLYYSTFKTSGNTADRIYTFPNASGTIALTSDIPASPGAIVVSSNTTAANDQSYHVVASATISDPTPVEGKGYMVLIRNGTATIGGTAYALSGTVIYRIYHSGSWANTVLIDSSEVIYNPSGAAYLDIPFPAGYKHHEIELIDVVAGTANSELWLRVLVGGVVQSGSSDYVHYRALGGVATSYTMTGAATDSKIVVFGAAMPTGASGRTFCGMMDVYNPDNSTYPKQFTGRAACRSNAGAFLGGISMASYAQTSALSGIRILCSTGTISGTIILRSH